MPKIKNATPTCYNGIKYRSKLEAKCAEILDKAGIEFEYESLIFELIPAFTYMGKKYRPWTYKTDFVIFDSIILEIKGFRQADNYVNKRKTILKYIIDHNLNYEFYEIYSEKHLKTLLERYAANGIDTFQEIYIDYENELKEKKKLKRKKK